MPKRLHKNQQTVKIEVRLPKSEKTRALRAAEIYAEGKLSALVRQLLRDKYAEIEDDEVEGRIVEGRFVTR